MIERVISSLASHGVTEAVLSLGYKPDAFIDVYPNGRCAGVELHYAVEPEPLDTAGAVRFAAREAGIEETFIVVNGDVLTDLDVAALWAFHQGHGAEGTIALTPVDDPSRYGVVPIHEDGQVIEFVEKPPPGTAPTNWINAGTYVLEPTVLDRIVGDRRVSIERETFPSMVADSSLFAMHSDAYWLDAGTPSAYLQAQLDLIDGTRSTETAIASSAQIDSTAHIERSVIGRHVVIANGASVHRSVIMDGTTVGPGARIHDSIVGHGVLIGPDSVLTDLTVIGDGIELPAQIALSGARVPDES